MIGMTAETGHCGVNSDISDINDTSNSSGMNDSKTGLCSDVSDILIIKTVFLY